MFTRLASLTTAALLFSAPALAQHFTHTHGGHTHSHDITMESTHGSCCHIQTCDRRIISRSSELSGAPAQTSSIKRTFTRTYVTTPSRSDDAHMTHRSRSERSVFHRERGPIAPVYTHRDRDQAWAHYDRRWKSRTNTR